MGNIPNLTKHLFLELNGVNIDKTLINEGYMSKLRFLLYERAGINNEVKKEAQSLANKIGVIFENNKENFRDYGYVKAFYSKNILHLWEHDVILDINFYSYTDESQWKEWKRAYQPSTYTNYDENLKRYHIQFTVSAKDGIFPFKVVISNLQHELTHLFQLIKMGSQEPFKSLNKKDLYGLVVSILQSEAYGKPYDVNSPISALASAIYGTFKFESDAYINTAYASLANVYEEAKGSPELKNKLIEELRNSHVQKILDCIKVSVDWLTNPPDDAENVKFMKELFLEHISLNQLIKRLETMYKYISIKFAKMVQLFSEEYNIDIMGLNRIY